VDRRAYQTIPPSQNTLTSAFILRHLKNLGIPSIAFICEPSLRHRHFSEREKELTKIVYSLAYQAAQILPVDLKPGPTKPNFSEDRFHKLEEQESIPEATELLRDLLAEGPPLLFCVIDGLQLLDSSRSGQHVKEGLEALVKVLTNIPPKATDAGKAVKVIFTTDGTSPVLAAEYKRRSLTMERYDEEEESEPLRFR